MKGEIINDWTPETKSLIERLLAAGFTILKVSNGEYVTPWPAGSLEEFIEECHGADECWLYVITPEGHRCTLYLVYGNEPGVLVADWTYPRELEGNVESLEAATDAHYDEWNGRTQPTKERQ